MDMRSPAYYIWAAESLVWLYYAIAVCWVLRFRAYIMRFIGQVAETALVAISERAIRKKIWFCSFRNIAQLVEHLSYTQQVPGSIPGVPTTPAEVHLP